MNVLGLNDLATLTSMENLASVLVTNGNFTDAERFLRLTMAGLNTVVVAGNPRTIPVAISLGRLLQRSSRNESAVGLYTQMLAGSETTLGDSTPHRDVAVPIASLLYRMGRFEEAQKMQSIWGFNSLVENFASLAIASETSSSTSDDFSRLSLFSIGSARSSVSSLESLLILAILGNQPSIQETGTDYLVVLLIKDSELCPPLHRGDGKYVEK